MQNKPREFEEFIAEFAAAARETTAAVLRAFERHFAEMNAELDKIEERQAQFKAKWDRRLEAVERRMTAVEKRLGI